MLNVTFPRSAPELAPKKNEQDKMERDFEMFLRDVEEDESMRMVMNLYRANEAQKKRDRERAEQEMETESTVDGSEDGRLRIPMEQLLEDMEEMGLEDEEME